MKRTLASLAIALLPYVLAAQTLEIVVIPKAKESPYWAVVQQGAIKAKADLAAEGITVNLVWDGPDREDQSDAQKNMVTSYVQKKVAAIVLAPSNAQTLVPAVEEAKAAGIPVVIIDSLLASEAQVATVATNNYKAGLMAGVRLAESMQGKGNVAVLRFLKGHGSTQPREAGFLDAMKRNPGIKVVSADMTSGATKEEAEKNAAALLQKVGADLQGVFTPNMPSTQGMLSALQKAGLAGKVAFVGFDAADEHVKAIEDGHMQGLVVQRPFMMGEVGVKTAVAAAQKKQVEKSIDADVKVVTKDNLKTPEVQKLLKP